MPYVGFNAGDGYEWFKAVHADDEFHGYYTLLGWVEKKRSANLPRMFVGTIRRTYINQRDGIVANICGHELRFGFAPTEQELLYGAKTVPQSRS